MNEPRFIVKSQDFNMYSIYNCIQGFDTHIHLAQLHWSAFSVGRWLAELCAQQNGFLSPGEHACQWLSSQTWKDMTMGEVLEQQAETVLHLGAPYNNKEDNAASMED